MKMLKNELEADASATSRIPIPSPRSTKRVDVPRYAAPPPARLVPDPHVEDEAVDEVLGLRKQKKGIKTGVSFPPSPKNVRSLSKRDGP